MLRQDALSKTFIVVAVMLTIFLYLYVGFEVLVTPILLLAGSVIIRVYTNKKVSSDPHIDKTETGQIMFYTVLALAGLAVGGLFAENLFLPQVPQQILSIGLPMVSVAFSVLMAISETQFFQGEFLDLLSMKTMGFAMLISSLIFTSFHWKIYGTSEESLLYVFVGGLMLAFAAWRTKRVVPAMLAHIINNVGGPVLNPMLVLCLVLGCVAILAFQKRRMPTSWTL
jgi:membrane protease YdiL (CAAX protease family)